MIDYSKYPPNWKTEIRPRILARAENKCEWCDVDNHAYGIRDVDGKWWNYTDTYGMSSDHGWQTFGTFSPKWITIVLTIAHVHDHDPMNCADNNLAALCQRCHLNHDRPRHIANARKNRRNKRDLESGQARMFADDN